MFASERRKAKVLNFSIAYGKTAHGLSKDWRVSLDEAIETVKCWYADRPEVRLGEPGGDGGRELSLLFLLLLLLLPPPDPILIPLLLRAPDPCLPPPRAPR